MRGEASVLNKIIVEHHDNHIKEDIGGVSKARITEVINAEFWKEFKRRIDFSEEPSLYVDGLGTFFTKYSYLKGHIRSVIRQLRRLRKRIEKLKAEKKSFNPDNSMTVAIEKQLVFKLRAAWRQLDKMRMNMILRIIIWNKKQIKLGTPERIKRHYEKFNWSFDKELLNNSFIQQNYCTND